MIDPYPGMTLAYLKLLNPVAGFLQESGKVLASKSDRRFPLVVAAREECWDIALTQDVERLLPAQHRRGQIKNDKGDPILVTPEQIYPDLPIVGDQHFEAIALKPRTAS